MLFLIAKATAILICASLAFFSILFIFFVFQANKERDRFREFLRGDGSLTREPIRAAERLSGEYFAEGVIVCADGRRFFFTYEFAFRKAVSRFAIEPKIVCF